MARLATAIASLMLPLALACESDFDCQLNGACTAGVCSCRPGWTGSDCGQFDFLPAPTTHAFWRPTSASWGGSIVEEGGAWYMFLAFMEGNCGLNSWQPNSAIYRAVSTGGPAGPYVNETKLLSWFSHNPTVSVQPDGTTLVWHIGCGNEQGNFVTGCTNGTTPPPPPPPPVRFINAAGACLVPSGPYPCWTGGYGNGSVCPVVAGSCSDNSSLWGLDGGILTSHEYYPAAINVDCNKCTPGRVAKLYSLGGSSLAYNATSKQIAFTSSGCSTMCLTAGADGAQPPCGGGEEPWMADQIHTDFCNSSTTQGWRMVPVTGAGAAAAPLPAAPRSSSSSSSAFPPGFPIGCTDVSVLASTGGVLGPFTESGLLNGDRTPFPYETDNPAPLVFPNGSTWVMFRSWNPGAGPNYTTPIGIARSDGTSWWGNYTLTQEPVPRGIWANRSEPPVYVPLEDPFMWVDAASGTYHAVFHNMGGCAAVGCHAFSADGFTWYLATTPAYASFVEFADGSNVTYARRERPHLVLNALGQPAFLSNGVQEAWASDHTYTLVQPINVAFP